MKDCKFSVNCDVAVFGGGPSGVVAAAAAARNGASTALFEQYSFLGGLATAGLVTPISKFRKHQQMVIGGIPWELMNAVSEMGGADLSWPNGNVACDVEMLKIAAQRLVLNAGVDLWLQSKLIDCETENGRITHALVASCGEYIKVTAKEFIDCTADALLCRMSGAPMQEAAPVEDRQPASLIFRMAGVDTDALDRTVPSLENTRFFQKEFQDKLLGLRKDGVDVPNFGGPWFCTVMHDGIININITRTAMDAGDPKSVTKAECRMREDAFRFAELLREYHPAFKNAYILMTAPQAGLRESFRLKGAHVLTGDELINSHPFPDTIAHGAHLVDIHHAGNSNQSVQFLQDASNIPFRSLYAEEIPNLLVAGRSISADRVAFASTRVMGTAMATGQAAGTAAAMCAKQNVAPAELDTETLRSSLRSSGAIVD